MVKVSFPDRTTGSVPLHTFMAAMIFRGVPLPLPLRSR